MKGSAASFIIVSMLAGCATVAPEIVEPSRSTRSMKVVVDYGISPGRIERPVDRWQEVAMTKAKTQCRKWGYKRASLSKNFKEECTKWGYGSLGEKGCVHWKITGSASCLS